jgi:1-phosphatidylinositol-4-phosphate 5-kinase
VLPFANLILAASLPVLRSVDPHDLLKLVRWKRKKKGDSLKKKKSYVKGKVIDGEHELYTLSIAVMIGVRTSISRTNTVLHSLLPRKRWVNITDFRATEKYEFHPRGGGPLPAHQLAHTFKFKDYCPVVFAYLRRMYGVNEYDFLLSVCANANFIEFISNAKSGQFFFYSGDGRYMIKTMTNAESKHFRRILPDYFKHCCENPNTMITRFFGMYRVKLYHLRRNVKFVIMNSVYYTDKHLQSFYDLKGSTAGRDAKPGQAVLKDNDLRRVLPDQAFVFRPKQRQAIHDQVESDCTFLRSMGVMDYSMLVGVHYVPPFESRSSMVFKKNKAGRPRRNTTSSFVGEDSDTNESDSKAVGDMIVSYKKTRGSRHRRNTSASFNAEDSEATDYDSKGNGDGVVQESSMSSSHGDFMSTKSHKRSMSNGQNRARADTLGSYVTHSFEDGSEDEDNSYLLGSNNRPSTNHVYHEERELQKQATVEKLFWPFHHLFDIHGHRRNQPARCVTCKAAPCTCEDKDRHLLQGYNIPTFVEPLSDRKDGGFEMDTTGLQLPMKGKVSDADILYEGKIFYMGIIDILQEYGSRKELESLYRMMRTSDRLAASCVPPKDYSQRFLDFFDQYTRREIKANQDEEGVEVSVRI